MQTRNSIYRVMVIIILLVLLLGSAPATSAFQNSEAQLTTFARGAMDPVLKQMADGSIWLIGHYQEDWQPFYTISYNGGETWSPPALLWENWCYDLDLAQDASGRIWAAWSATVPDPYDPVYRTTANGGQTWSDVTKLSVPPDHDTVMSIVPISASETWLCWEGGCIASTDGGQTWGSVRTMPLFGWNNATFSRTRDGRLWVVTVIGGVQVQLQWSVDNGWTWSLPLTVANVEPAPPTPREPIRPVARLLEDSRGQLWIAWYAYSSFTGSSQVWFTKSTDDGITWSAPIQITTDPSFHGSYFSNISLAEVDGDIWVVYASDKSGMWQIYSQVEQEKGDVNGDGKVNVIDVRLCLQIATGVIIGTPAQRQAADVDLDGDVDLTDAQILAEYIIWIRSTFPGGE